MYTYQPYSNDPYSQSYGGMPQNEVAMDSSISHNSQNRQDSYEFDVLCESQCPNCGPIELTSYYQPTCLTYCLSLFLLGIPLCLKKCQDTVFICSKCQLQLGRKSWL